MNELHGDVPSADLAALLAERERWSAASFLRNASESALCDWSAVGYRKTFSPDDVLLAEGESGDDVLMLLSGTVKVVARLNSGGQALLAVRVAGDLVGELAATDGGPRSASVHVCGRVPVRALIVSREQFFRTLARHPEEALRVSAVVAGKLRTATRRRVDISGSPPLVRLARVLVELCEDHGERIETGSLIIQVNLTQVELGTLIGVAEATAQRSLSELRDRGLIASAGRRPIVRDLAGLVELARLTP